MIASALKPGDHVSFAGTPYTVESTFRHPSGFIGVTFVGTNDGQPYYYESDEEMGTPCAVEADRHSDDLVEVYSGSTEPTMLCGFHASQR